ncbi:MAG: protein-L-isoaspartate O-methyltransferase [Alphaproteobacteria bacterium]|nr:MAG: protein-L-isoaspartate O-methyltransferase [Alphaproteobacteria bacterium]
MTDFQAARRNMVEGQVRTNDVTDRRLQEAMASVPRERFLPEAKQDLAYMGKNVEIAPGRFLMGPRAFSKLVQALKVRAGDLALVIGSGTGYSAAILGRLADSVVAVESDEALVNESAATLSDLEIDNVAVVHGDPKVGLADQGPYDVVLFDGSVACSIDHIAAQLKDGGRLGVVHQDGPMGQAMLYSNIEGRITSRSLFDANVERLPGFDAEKVFAL